MYVNEFKTIFLFFYMNLLNENSSIYEQPNDINIVLKKHQLSMLYKSLKLKKNMKWVL